MTYSTSIGLDVHVRSISAAVFASETSEIVQKSFPYDRGRSRSGRRPSRSLLEIRVGLNNLEAEIPF